jgi:cytochrome c-type protein NapC
MFIITNLSAGRSSLVREPAGTSQEPGMISPLALGVLFTVMSMLLVAVVAFRSELANAPGGKALIFVALFVFPVIASWGGASEQLERSKQTSFCLSCHVMGDYGRSLYVDDKSYLPAAHFQNHRVPAQEACYTCHTDYAMYGGLRSKMRGMRHVYVQYFGKVPEPKDIKLYQAYNNKVCLHCHLGARSFEEHERHRKTPQTMADIKSNKVSCMSNNCHDIVHDVGTLKDAPVWKGGS